MFIDSQHAWRTTQAQARQMHALLAALLAALRLQYLLPRVANDAGAGARSENECNTDCITNSNACCSPALLTAVHAWRTTQAQARHIVAS